MEESHNPVLAIAFALVLLQGCLARTTPSGPGTPTYWPTDSWRESTPERQGVDSDALTRALEYAREADLNLHSVLLVRHGHIVFEAVFYPYDGKTPHDIASVTKSVTSTLVGAAIKRGDLGSTDETLVQVFGERALTDDDPRKARITIGHLLSMSSGFDCGYRPGEAELQAMMASSNWVDFALSLPMASQPGERSGYCSPGMHLLSAVLSAATGLSEHEFAEVALFEPLGIDSGDWPGDPQGLNHGWGDLRLLPRDMAKIGLLALHGGRWDRSQLLPKGWIESATRPRVPVPGDREEVDYGYGWWVLSGDFKGVFEARGRGGQYITVWPQQDLVLVMTGGGYDRTDFVTRLREAITPSAPLPENPEGLKRLRAAIAAARRPPSAVDPGESPPIASEICGRDYEFDVNPIGLRSLRLDFDGDGKQARFSFRFTEELAPQAVGTYAMDLGLDGRYRFNEDGPRGYRVGLRGRWLDDTRFHIRYAEPAGTNQFDFILRFEDDAIEAVVEDLTGLYGRHRFLGRVVVE